MRFIRKNGHVIPIAGKSAVAAGTVTAAYGAGKYAKNTAKAAVHFNQAVRVASFSGMHSNAYYLTKVKAQGAAKAALKGAGIFKFGAGVAGLGVAALALNKLAGKKK